MTEAVDRIVNSNDWITILLLLVIALFIYTKLRRPERFQKLQTLLINNSYINDYSKSTPLILNGFNIVFYVILIIVISLLLFVAINQYNSAVSTYSVNYFFLIFIYVFSFIILRFILGFLLGVLFQKEKEQQYFSFLKISYLSNFSLIMFPLLILNFYIGLKWYSNALVIAALLLFLYYYGLLIKNNQKMIFDKLFYFILYLCALEIAPFIIIYKLLVI